MNKISDFEAFLKKNKENVLDFKKIAKNLWKSKKDLKSNFGKILNFSSYFLEMITDDIMKNYEFTSLKFYTDKDFKKLVFADGQTEILLQNLVCQHFLKFLNQKF